MARGKVYEIAFNLAAKIGGSFNSAFTSASSHMKAMQSNVIALKAQTAALEKSFKSGEISLVKYMEKWNGLRREMEATQKTQAKLGRAMALQQKTETVAGKAKNVMTGAAVAGAAMAVPVMAAVSFDTELAYVAKQVDGARDETGKLTEIGLQAKADIMQMSKDLMMLPNDVANAYALGARAGVKGTENLRKITEIGIMMGTAFEMPAEQVTTDMAKIGNALGYNLETAEGIAKLEALADKINYVDDQTLATGPDLINFMTRTAGTIKALAPTMSEGLTIGLGGGLLAAGERAEVAGTAINAMLTKFAAAPMEAKGFHEALATIGMSAEELQSNIIKDADAAILDLFNRINQLDQATRNNVMAELIGKEHIDTVSKITGNYDKFLDAIKKANDEAAKGSVRKEFEIMSQTSKRQLEGLQASLARTMVVLGNAFLPTLSEASQALAGVADKVAAFAQEHPQLIEFLSTAAIGLTGFALAASGVTWVVSSAISPFLQFYTWATKIQLGTKLWTAAQWALNVAMNANPIGLVIIAIAALIGAGYALYKNWDAVRQFLINFWNNPTARVLAFIAGPIGSLITVAAFVVANWETLKYWFTMLWNDPAAALQAFIDGIYAKFAPVLQWLEEKWTKIKSLFSGGLGAPSVSATGPGIASNAAGGIYNKGAFLTTFAERSGEAAIPLDGSARAKSLWAQAGEILGMRSGGGTAIQATFAPTINAGAGADTNSIRQVLKDAMDDFERRLEALAAQQRRLSYE